MGIGDKLRADDLAARRAITIKRTMWAITGLICFLFVLFYLFYFLLPMWRN